MADRTTSRKRRARAPKGDREQAGHGRATPKASARYTPPVPRENKVSPRWYPYLILGLLVLGLLCIVLNYLGLLPRGASNWYLLVGLVLIAAGFLTATGYR